MATLSRAGRLPLIGKRSRGQSLPLIALMIVVLVAMVGLSVDVGNTFSQERQAVLASNTASLNAMNEVLKGTNTNNQNVRTRIQDSFVSNRVDAVPFGETPGPGQLVWTARYLDKDGMAINSGASIPNDANTPPNTVAFVQVELSGDVDTYFARAVGRNELPIASNSYAGVCPAGEGVYPIGVNVEVLNMETGRFREPPEEEGHGQGNTFDWDWDEIDDDGTSLFSGKTKMRIPLNSKFPGSTSTAGNFGFLRWTDEGGSGNAGNLAESLRFPGNLASGYSEVPADDLGQLVAADYPASPGTFNVGDWIWGNSGLSSSSAVRDAFQDHVDRGTQMMLPIYDPDVQGSGVNSKFKTVGIGLFVITAYQLTGQGYIEMIYLGDATSNQSACSYSAVPSSPERCCELAGNVSFYPQYQQELTSRTPVRYVVVVDVSGSMSANFEGKCNVKDGNTLNPAVQCAAATAADGTTLTNAAVSDTGVKYYWGKDNNASQVNERRAVVARNAIKELVAISNMTENNDYDSTAPFEDEIALVWFNSGSSATGNIAKFKDDGTYKSNGAQVFSATPAGLNAALDAIIPNRPQGGTNAAAGLYRAYTLLRDAPRRYDAQGNEVNFKNVVILVTDGLSNQTFHQNASNYSLGTYNIRTTYPTGHRCGKTTDVPVLYEDAQCMQNIAGWASGYTPRTLASSPSTSDTLSRPMTQVGEVSELYLKQIVDGEPRAEVFAIGLSGATSSGMGSVVSNGLSTNYFTVREASRLDDAFRNIYNRTSIPTCLSTALEERQTVDASQFISTGGFSYPAVGEVSISGITHDGQTITGRTAPIRANPQNGNQLSYNYTDFVPPGEYTLNARLYFRWPDDVFTGAREYSLFNEGAESIQVTVSATTSNGNLQARTTQDLSLFLNGNICPAN